jgi:uncharacterized membrane protein YidH (DUF202 family)
VNALSDDPGVANERTALAWRRSALSLLVVGGVMLHGALDGRLHPLRLAVLGALVLAAAATHRHGRRLYELRAGDGDAHVACAARGLAALSGVTLAAAVAALLALVS